MKILPLTLQVMQLKVRVLSFTLMSSCLILIEDETLFQPLILISFVSCLGYHWDCSDWALINDSHNQQSMQQHQGNKHLEVSTNEVRDSESNSDNSQIELTGEDVRRLSIRNGRRKGFVGSSSSSLETSLTENNRKPVRGCTSSQVMEEDEQEDVHESTGLLSLDDIEFADRSPSDKYASHPNSYLPIYQSIAGDMDGSDGGGSEQSDHTSCKTKSDLNTDSNTTLNTAHMNGNHSSSLVKKDLKQKHHENGTSETMSSVTVSSVTVSSVNGDSESTFV